MLEKTEVFENIRRKLEGYKKNSPEVVLEEVHEKRKSYFFGLYKETEIITRRVKFEATV